MRDARFHSFALGLSTLISPEEDEAEVVDALLLVLHVDAVHVHEDVSDHHHRRLVVVPRIVQRLQEVVVEGSQHVVAHLVLQVGRHHVLQARVQPLAVLVQHHCVGVPEIWVVY